MPRKTVQPCRHCGKPIDFPEIRPEAQRASRPKFCSDYCRLYSKVDTSPGHGPRGDCHVYTGAKHKFGYGLINTSGSKASELTTAHVYAWEVNNGPVPEGMFVLHKCDYPPCCREDHLFLGNHQINMDDMVDKGRNVVGENSALAKLTEDQVREIRRDSGLYSDRELAAKYGVSHALIQGIRKHRRWKHIS